MKIEYTERDHMLSGDMDGRIIYDKKKIMVEISEKEMTMISENKKTSAIAQAIARVINFIVQMAQ